MEGRTTEVSLRSVMGCFPTGVTVVATRDLDGVPWGLTVNSFASVSLEPPLVLVCISRDANTHDRLIDADGFTVSVLSASQAALAERFAEPPSEGRFRGVEWQAAPSGNPVLAGAVAWLDCLIDEVMNSGDHSILIGRAVAASFSDEPALVFHRGVFGSIGG